MTGDRAIAALASLLAGKPAFTADEIEELLAAGLAVEADAYDFDTLGWLVPIVQQHAGVEVEDPLAIANLMTALGELDKKLKSDWHRFTTKDAKLAEQETHRRDIRRALGVLNDTHAHARLKHIIDTAQAVRGIKLAPCTELGDELYAITPKGQLAHEQLVARRGRYGNAPLAAFLKAHDKVAAKMEAFSNDIATLRGGIGAVKKNPHQVVIGLAKAGGTVKDALGEYRSLRHTAEPDVAVTVTRAAATAGGVDEARKRLDLARKALRRTGLHQTPVLDGCAKTLLPFESLDEAATRFRELVEALDKVAIMDGERGYKFAARLMPASGTPAEIVVRVNLASRLLADHRGSVSARARGREWEEARTRTAVALAAMVPTREALPDLVTRFRDLEHALHEAGISSRGSADDDAIECIGCPGTPDEVAATVKALLAQLVPNREWNRGDVAIAVAFAKRFAY